MVFGSALMTTAALIVSIPQSATATTTRVLQGSATCTDGWYPSSLQIAAPVNSGYTAAQNQVAVPATHAIQFTNTISSTATSARLDARCGGFFGENAYFSYVPANLTPGTTTVNVTWQCSRFPVYPGPYVHKCDAASVTYS
ncbi:hypothetical protein [Acrocarpospora corrugata]|nr:hypothetical protein [Acrocarpospora corrugata]